MSKKRHNPHFFQSIWRFLWIYRFPILLISVGLLAFISHTVNMWGYPYYHNDEGTYSSQAWSWATRGTLSPTTFWYDHAPLGTILMGIWIHITGGVHAFGFSLHSTRLFMALIHVGSTVILFLLSQKITRSLVAATIACFLFSLSPLAITYQRRVLLDNIMTFFMLLSYLLLVKKQAILSAITFGLGALSKESILTLAPLYIGIVATQQKMTSLRWKAALKWICVVMLTLSPYGIYAFLHQELFPYGSAWGGEVPHPSFIETMLFQAKRWGGFFWQPNSDIANSFTEWVMPQSSYYPGDPLLIFGGVFATIMLLLFAGRQKGVLLSTIPSLIYIAFLLRGGVVFFFYLVPLIPLFAMTIGMSIVMLRNYLMTRFLTPWTANLAISGILVFFCIFYAAHPAPYILSQTKAQYQALSWISHQNKPTDRFIIDDYAYIEFHSDDPKNPYTLPPVGEYYWKVDSDPLVRWNIFDNTWQNIDYLLLSPTFVFDAKTFNIPLVRQAYEHAKLIEFFSQDGHTTMIAKVYHDK